jgi:hypothetical protein
MISLRRYYRHYFGHHPRFVVTVMLTIFAVAYIGVPQVLRVVDSIAHYDPRHYEPKDTQRADWLAKQGPVLKTFDWDELLKIALLVVVGVAWVTLMPARGRSRRPPLR